MNHEIMKSTDDERQIRQLVENWAQAVRNRDLPGILVYHSDDVVMYDVPKPFRSAGIEAYRKTWNTFFACTKPGIFDFQELTVVTSNTVAFCFATMMCEDRSGGRDYIPLAFRLTVGLQKVNDQWTIVHEHHSIPSE